MIELIEKLCERRSLDEDEYAALIEGASPESAELLAARARDARRSVYGDRVFVRGLIEISSYCKNDCLYCGLRRSNASCERYRLSEDEIVERCAIGRDIGLRTFVLQGGEDAAFTDRVLSSVICEIKAMCPDAAVTLSLGERGRLSFDALRRAGADRYLLRHETADADHYASLHDEGMSFDRRMSDLRALKELGYQTGCGFMVGTPGQTPRTIAKDLKFIETFRPEMCGIGPFIPHRDTPLGAAPRGSVELTCFLLSVVRVMLPEVLLPATTALGSIAEDGRERGIAAGGNVVMPNLSPPHVRSKYSLYDGKLTDGAEAAEGMAMLRDRIETAGCEMSLERGDHMTKGDV